MEQTIKRKGRPVKDINDPQSTSCIIKDDAMEPFYIIKDATNFTVVEKSLTTRGFGGKKSLNREQEKTIGYYTTFSNALNSIAKQKFYQNKGEYTSIKEYIGVWNEVKTGLENLLKSIEI